MVEMPQKQYDNEIGLPGRSSAGDRNSEILKVKLVFDVMNMDKITKGVMTGKEEG